MLSVGFGPLTGGRRLPDVARGLPETQAAIEFARLQHSGQRRSTDGAPFIEHPLEVGWLLDRAGKPDDVIAAGVLHDVVEKTAVSVEELRSRFGPRVAELVAAVSEDEKIRGYEQRKSALRRQVAVAGPEALTVFAADKVSKVRELRAAIAGASRRREPLGKSLVPPRRLTHFRRCLGMLEERLSKSPLVVQLRTELDGLRDDLRSHKEISSAA